MPGQPDHRLSLRHPRPFWWQRCVTHPPLDNAVVELDREELPFDCCHFEATLREEMRCKPLPYLAAHYPELIFARLETKTTARPPGWDFYEEIGRRKWAVARWRGVSE